MQASKMQAFERYAREGDAPMRCNPLMRCTRHEMYAFMRYTPLKCTSCEIHINKNA
jgi:hypothetical protein